LTDDPSPKPDYPLDRFLKILERAGIELSPVELAELLWIRLQQGEEVTQETQILEIPPEITTTSPPTLDINLPPPPLPVPKRTQDLPQNRSANLVTEPPKTTGMGSADGGSMALPVRIPDAVALRNRREIARSLRPLKQKIPSQQWQILDEEATVLQIAESQVLTSVPDPKSSANRQFHSWSPVVKPELERWLDLAIVVEVTNIYEVWRDTIAEFQHLLERHGAFRDVRSWHLKADESGDPQLYLQTASGLKGKPRKSKELLGSGGRRLILLLSDCTSKVWRSGKIPELLKAWSRENPVTIVQLLPLRYWDRTVIGSCHLVGLRSQKPAPLSSEWKIEGLSAWRMQRLPKGLKLKIPVVTIHPNDLGNWANAIATEGEQLTTGIVLVPRDYPAQKSEVPSNEDSIQKAKRIVRDFRGTASEKAQDLADRMAVLPVNWSVIRLIQKNWGQSIVDPLQDTDALYLAEVFLSGLIAAIPQETPDKDQRARPKFDFVKEVRKVLLGVIPISESLEVGETIAQKIFEGLPQDVQDRVNADIKQRGGEALSYFEAFLIPDLPWGTHEADILSFAKVNEEILRGWGGNYAALADELKSISPRPDPQPTPLPSPPINEEYFEYPVATLIVLETLSFEVATLTLSLEAFEFTVATLQITGKGNRSRLTIQRQTQQVWQFTEDLGTAVNLEMVAIPPGKFLMGSPPDELERRSNEDPQHEVSIESFFMGKYTITQAQWRQVASFPQINRELDPDPSRFKGGDRPVERITWYDAVEFCERLSQKTGRSYRLPTEAEWEYACRAINSEAPLIKGGQGGSTPFHFGETISTDLANYDGNYTYGVGKKGIYREETSPVGSFKVANHFGLYDMHGNVWEWCEDEWHENYEGAPTDGTAWTAKNDENSSKKVLRGGSWSYYPFACRSAFRYRDDPDGYFNTVGLRVACSASRTL